MSWEIRLNSNKVPGTHFLVVVYSLLLAYTGLTLSGFKLHKNT